jgi:hypothetical protein
MATLPVVAPVAEPPSHNRTRALVVGAIVGLLIVGAVGFAWSRSSNHDGDAASASATANVSTTLPAALGTIPIDLPTLPTEAPPITVAPRTAAVDPVAVQQATALNAMLDQSRVARSTIQGASNDVVGCGDVARGVELFASARVARSQLLDGLGVLRLDQLPEAAALRSWLTTAWESSVNADAAYEALGANLMRMPQCTRSAVLQDANYGRAGQYDGTSSHAKQQFVLIWNSIAPTYNLEKRTDADI